VDFFHTYRDALGFLRPRQEGNHLDVTTGDSVCGSASLFSATVGDAYYNAIWLGSHDLIARQYGISEEDTGCTGSLALVF